MVCPRNRVELVIVVGMDSQDTANLISLGSMLATFGSTFFAWRQAIGSKKAKSEAEEQARRADESLKQMQQIVAEQQSQSQSQAKIAASLQSPPFELTPATDSVKPSCYKLRNTTTETLKILDVVNCDSFNEWRDWNDKFPWELHPDQSIQICLVRSASVLNLELEVEGKDAPIFITIPSAN